MMCMYVENRLDQLHIKFAYSHNRQISNEREKQTNQPTKLKPDRNRPNSQPNESK